jgi:hypothetical protein
LKYFNAVRTRAHFTKTSLPTQIFSEKKIEFAFEGRMVRLKQWYYFISPTPSNTTVQKQGQLLISPGNQGNPFITYFNG